MFPFIWTVCSSLKTPAELVLFPPPLLPYAPQWGNYAELWQRRAVRHLAARTR